MFLKLEQLDRNVYRRKDSLPIANYLRNVSLYIKLFFTFIKKDVDRAREIFTHKKKDIEYFIKNQIDLSYGNNLNNYFHVPKILSVILNQIKNIITSRKNLDYLSLYQSINGSSEWFMEYENNIVDIKILMNKGDWEIIDAMTEETDINILIELCYDWLEDCVTHVINPATIKKLFEEFPTLYKDIKKSIERPELFTKENRKSVIKLLGENLRLNEFETLTVVAKFASEIFPKEDPKQKHEFNLMLEKFSTYLMGYNIDIFMETTTKLDKKIEDVVDKLTDILMLFIITIRLDSIKEDNRTHQLFSVNNSMNSCDNQNLFPNPGTGERKLNLDSKIQIDLNKNLEINKEGHENSPSPNVSESKNSINKKDIENDLLLYDMYKTLEIYFKKKNSHINPSNIEYLQQIQHSPFKNRKSTEESNFKELESEIINDICFNLNKVIENKINGTSVLKEKMTINSNNFINSNRLNNQKMHPETDNSANIYVNDSKNIVNVKKIQGMIKETEEENHNFSLSNNNMVSYHYQLGPTDSFKKEDSIKKIDTVKSEENNKHKREINKSNSNASYDSLASKKKIKDVVNGVNGSENYEYIRPKSRNRTNSNFQLRFSCRELSLKANEYLEK